MTPKSDRSALFAHAFAEAVIGYIDSGRPHGIDYDATSGGYVTGPLEAGTSPTDTGVWVGARWTDLTGPMTAETDPARPGFSFEALRQDLRRAAQESPLLLQLAVAVADDDAAADLLAQNSPSARRH